MTESKPAAGRLKGAKSPSYVRATGTPESRASQFTARSMLVSDVAYVLSAAELGYTPADSARRTRLDSSVATSFPCSCSRCRKNIRGK